MQDTYIYGNSLNSNFIKYKIQNTKYKIQNKNKIKIKIKKIKKINKNIKINKNYNKINGKQTRGRNMLAPGP